MQKEHVCAKTEESNIDLALVEARLDEITSLAEERMRSADGMFVASVGGAAISFMTPEEIKERHELMLKLPSFAELREMARKRIQQRIAERKANRLVSNVVS